MPLEIDYNRPTMPPRCSCPASDFVARPPVVPAEEKVRIVLSILAGEFGSSGKVS
jgi:hypothetical protein